MKISFDRVADAGYIKISNKKISKTIHATNCCNIDVDERGGIIGIELLFISEYMDDFKFWLSLASAAEYLNKSSLTIRRWTQNGKLPSYRIGREYLFIKEDLDNFIQQHKQG
jgi:excisionase family DNA binding protein